MSEHLLILGASTRAAAFSALRAGLTPWCADLFGDADLAARCPVRLVPRSAYPHGLAALAAQGPPGAPWMYTGGLENHPRLVEAITRERPLWGSGPAVLLAVRDPDRLSAAVAPAGWSMPAVRWRPDDVPRDGSWLVKPAAGSGGTGIDRWRGQRFRRGLHYFQQRVRGRPFAAIYLGDGRRSWLLGVTEQLVGVPALHARPFAYCGSIGPLHFSFAQNDRFHRLGQALVEAFGLCGLFGVDGVLDGETGWVLEVNPRYTASVELLEYACGTGFLAGHRDVFQGGIASSPRLGSAPAAGVWAKAILFARAALVFPADGPWRATLDEPRDVHTMPAYADIPPAGTRIKAGWPVLTFFVRAESEPACREQLAARAGDLDRWLFRG
jgi:predicted ATP-grasp superfamily ATP-dependent carboligase